MAIIFNEYDLVNHDDRLVEDQVYQESVIAGILIGGGIIAAVATIIAIVSKHLKKSAAGNPEKKNDDSSAEGLSIDKPDEVKKKIEEVRTKLTAIGGTVTIPDGFIDFEKFNKRLENYTKFAERAKTVLDTEGDDIIKKLDELEQMISSMSEIKYIESGSNNQVNNEYLDKIITCAAMVQGVTKTYDEVSQYLTAHEKTSKEKADKETDNAKKDQANKINEKIKKLSAEAKKIGINANDDMSKFRALINNIINTVNSASNTQTKDNKQQNPTNTPANNGNGNNNEPPGISAYIDNFVNNNSQNKSGTYTMTRDEVSDLVTKIYDCALNKNQDGIRNIVNSYIESNEDTDRLEVFRKLLAYIDHQKIIQLKNGMTFDLIPEFGDEIKNKIESLSNKVGYIVQKTQKEKAQFEKYVSKHINKDYETFVQEILEALDHTNEDEARQAFIDLTNNYMKEALSQGGNLFKVDTKTQDDGSTVSKHIAKDNFVDYFVWSCQSIFEVIKSKPDLYENVINIDFGSIDGSYIHQDPNNSNRWMCMIDGDTTPAPRKPDQSVTNAINKLIREANKNKMPFLQLTKEEMITLVDGALQLMNDGNKLEDYFEDIINNNGNNSERLQEIYNTFIGSKKLFNNNSIVTSKLIRISDEITRIKGLRIITRPAIQAYRAYNNAIKILSNKTTDQQNEVKQTIGNPNNIIEEIISEIDQKDFDTAANILIDKYKKYMGKCIANGVFIYNSATKKATIDNNKKVSFDMVTSIFDDIAKDCAYDNNGVKMFDKLGETSLHFKNNDVSKDLYEECSKLANHSTNFSPDDEMVNNIDLTNFISDASSKGYSVNMSEDELAKLAKEIFNEAIKIDDGYTFNTYIIGKANDNLGNKDYLQTLRDLTIIVSKDQNFPTNIPQSEIDDIVQKINGVVQKSPSATTQANQIAKTFSKNGMNIFTAYANSKQSYKMKDKEIKDFTYHIIQNINQDVAQIGTYIAGICKSLKNSSNQADQGKLIIFKRLVFETLNTIGINPKVINNLVGLIIDEIPDNLKDIIAETTAAANNSPSKQAIPQLEQLLSIKYDEICNNVINDCKSNNIANIIQTYKAYLGALMNADCFVQNQNGEYNYDTKYTDMIEMLRNSLYTTVNCFNNVSSNTIDPMELYNIIGDFKGSYTEDQYNEFIQMAGNTYGHKQINKAFTTEKFIQDDLSGHLDPASGVHSTGSVKFDNPGTSEVSNLLSLQQASEIDDFFKNGFNNYNVLVQSGFINEFIRISNLAKYITLMGLNNEGLGVIRLSQEGVAPILKFYPMTGKEISKIDIHTDRNTYDAAKTTLKNSIQNMINNVISLCEQQGAFGKVFNNSKRKEAYRKKMENFVTNALDAMDKLKQYYDYIMNKGNNP